MNKILIRRFRYFDSLYLHSHVVEPTESDGLQDERAGKRIDHEEEGELKNDTLGLMQTQKEGNWVGDFDGSNLNRIE